MKNKKISKVVLSVLTSMSMLSSYSAMVFAENTTQATSQVAHEYDLVKLDRNGDLIVNGSFDNNGASWSKTGAGTFGNDNGNYYGTLRSEVSKHLNNGESVILEIEIEGALNIKKLVPEAIFIFILPPNMQTLLSRLKSRGTEDDNKIISLFRTAYKEINEITKYNYVVVNDKIENAVSKVKAIIQAEKCRVERIEEIKLDNKEELIHEILIDKDFNNDEMRI